MIKNEPRFRARWHGLKPRYWFRKDRDRPDGVRDRPEVLRIDPAPGVKPSDKPSVRIFLGTETEQCRAERVFVWSVLQARDPARAYEIHLMKDLKGFDRRGWETGFANYRYAIPHLADGAGRAIYNQVDQIWLADPAGLFDIDMGGAGVLAADERDHSVMLIDCARMADAWPPERAREGGRHGALGAAMPDAGAWRRLPGEWSARDGAYRPGLSKCLRFAALQTQPWRPYPDRIRYQPHAHAEVWDALERAADAAGFTVFTKDRPSRRFGELIEQYRLMHERGDPRKGRAAARTFDGHQLAKHEADIARLVAETGARTLLDYGAGKGMSYLPLPGETADPRVKRHPAWPDVRVTCYDPGHAPFAAPYEGTFDGVLTTDVLEHIPDDDIPWLLDELFAAARRFVYGGAACFPARKLLPNGENPHCTVQPPEWWQSQMELAARRHPGIRWTLCAEERGSLGPRRRLISGGGRLAEAA